MGRGRIVLCGVRRTVKAPVGSSLSRYMKTPCYRILCVGETWMGSDARASFAAFERLGQSIQVLDESHYVTNKWPGGIGKGLRRSLRQLMAKQLSRDLLSATCELKHNCF